MRVYCGIGPADVRILMIWTLCELLQQASDQMPAVSTTQGIFSLYSESDHGCSFPAAAWRKALLFTLVGCSEAGQAAEDLHYIARANFPIWKSAVGRGQGMVAFRLIMSASARLIAIPDLSCSSKRIG